MRKLILLLMVSLLVGCTAENTRPRAVVESSLSTPWVQEGVLTIRGDGSVIFVADRGTNTPPPEHTTTGTPEPTATDTETPTPQPTDTETPTPTDTATPTPTDTATPTPTDTATPTSTPSPTPTPNPNTLTLVFVSRKLQGQGSQYWDTVNDLPGVGAHSRVRPAIPGKLLVREDDGTIRVLIDGSNPLPATLNLVDVNGPAVSYDGSRIVFAGLQQGTYDTNVAKPVGGWRIYTINVDGTGLKQVTFSDCFKSFPDGIPQTLTLCDDYDPVYLPDGRLVFSSTRWPAYGHYSGVPASQLFVINTDGTHLHRITAERNGADRPLVDPTTGKIVYSRWWRNHRFPLDSMEVLTYTRQNGTITEAQRDGLTTDRTAADATMFRNAWQIATINPDGTGLAMFTGAFRDEEQNHYYGGGFSDDGQTLIGNFFPMFNMTEAAGFGGLRVWHRGLGGYTPLVGRTSITPLDYVRKNDPATSKDENSYGILNTPDGYWAEPEVLRDGRIVASRAATVTQDYGLWLLSADGKTKTLLYDNLGTTELRARAIRSRAVPPIITDTVLATASLLPPHGNEPIAKDGTFLYLAVNVYANAPVDVPIVSAPAVGSLNTMRFFADYQRTSAGSFPLRDWPIVLSEKQVSAAGFVSETAPANVPLFEQGRTSAAAGYKVPFTGAPGVDGLAHVAGMNFGRPGATASCIGCHAGHSALPVPADLQAASWSNLAPGAAATASSTRANFSTRGLIDRQVMRDSVRKYWVSDPAKPQNGQAVTLTFPVNVQVLRVVLYAPRPDSLHTIKVNAATVDLYDASGNHVAQVSGVNLTSTGTPIEFTGQTVRSVRVTLTNVTGKFENLLVASLAEVEVISRGT